MCFRPAKVERPPKKCPECGAMSPGMAKVCVKCKALLESSVDKPTEDKPKGSSENK